MDIKELEQKVLQVFKLLNKPFQEQVGEPMEIVGSTDFLNFLRNGPNRKLVIFNESYGDYEHEESMSDDVEISIGADNDAIYSAAVDLLTKEFGTPSPQPVESYDELPFSRIHFKESADVEDGEWTPEYDGGALFENADDFVFEYWHQNNQYIVLQNGKIWGDGDFTFYVLVAISKH